MIIMIIIIIIIIILILKGICSLNINSTIFKGESRTSHIAFDLLK